MCGFLKSSLLLTRICNLRLQDWANAAASYWDALMFDEGANRALRKKFETCLAKGKEEYAKEQALAKAEAEES